MNCHLQKTAENLMASHLKNGRKAGFQMLASLGVFYYPGEFLGAP